nr:TPA_asm: E1^E4 [Manis javanica papillomavirus 1]
MDKKAILRLLLDDSEDKENQKERGRERERKRRNRAPRERNSPSPSPRPTEPPRLRRGRRTEPPRLRRGRRVARAGPDGQPLEPRLREGHPPLPPHPPYTPPLSDEEEEDSDEDHQLQHFTNQLRHLQKTWEDYLKRLSEEVGQDLEDCWKRRETRQ